MIQSLYTYLRVLADHSQHPPAANTLRQLIRRESDFCVRLMRDKWNDVMLIGRDLVRLLANLYKLDDIQLVLRHAMHAPAQLSVQYEQLGGLIYLLRLPTRRRCLISRLTVDMERKIYFVITSVKQTTTTTTTAANTQWRRYLDWFQRAYLSTAESQSLRADLVRYICAVVHPTNEKLNAGYVTRWSMCAWLMSTCTSVLELANIKQALFYDWFFYDARKDNIMLIEPAILLMLNSTLSKAPSPSPSPASAGAGLTASLFDFLCRSVEHYHAPLREHVLNGVEQAFRDCVDKRVINTLQVFFVPPPLPIAAGAAPVAVIDAELRHLVHATFGDFFQTLSVPQPPPPPPPARVMAKLSLPVQVVEPLQAVATLASPTTTAAAATHITNLVNESESMTTSPVHVAAGVVVVSNENNTSSVKRESSLVASSTTIKSNNNNNIMSGVVEDAAAAAGDDACSSSSSATSVSSMADATTAVIVASHKHDHHHKQQQQQPFTACVRLSTGTPSYTNTKSLYPLFLFVQGDFVHLYQAISLENL